MSSQPLLSAREVAELAGVSYHSVLRAVRAGRLRGHRVCGKVRITQEAYEEWAFADPVQPPPEPPAERSHPVAPPARGSFAALKKIERGGEAA